MKENFFSTKLSLVAASAFLFLGSVVNAQNASNQHKLADPCSEKTQISCGTEYTAVLQPNSGAWMNYTEVPYDYPGSEKVWEFTAPATGPYKFDLDQGQSDADFFLMDACSNTAGNVTHFYWPGEQSEYVNLQQGVTYYLIADLYASSSTTVKIKINCPGDTTIPFPNFPCYQGDGKTTTIDEGLNLDPLNPNTFVADDFTVATGTQFKLHQVTLDTNQMQVPDHAVINFRKDEGGHPGAIVKTVNVDTTSSIMYATAYGEPVYHVTFDLQEPVTFEEGTYWIQPKVTTPEPSTVWWVATASGNHGALPQLSEDGGATWQSMAGLQMVFFVAGECSALGVNDATKSDFSYYPNPAKETLYIKSNSVINSVEIFNTNGQKLQTTTSIQNGQVDVHHLVPGVYVFKAHLSNGQTKTFKVVKK